MALQLDEAKVSTLNSYKYMAGGLGSAGAMRLDFADGRCYVRLARLANLHVFSMC